MKRTAHGARPTQPTPAAKTTAPVAGSRIHPVISYPFRHPHDYTDLEELYRFVGQLDADQAKYARPLTVLDRKTHYALGHDPRFASFRESVVSRHTEILDAWCVDTCQMWYTGLGAAFERGRPGDVYWLIPGDFNYGTALGREVLGRLHDLPEIILELNQDLCVGEIETAQGNPKRLIDTYGTFGLLYNWFPAEAREIRQFTEQPRSEFFALSHAFLGEVLQQRWYAYEQTMVMLLQAVFGGKKISRFFVGNISDLPEGRESLSSAMQQVERTERVLKTLWRERHEQQAGWTQQYRSLETQSEQIVRTALVILQNLLTTS